MEQHSSQEITSIGTRFLEQVKLFGPALVGILIVGGGCHWIKEGGFDELSDIQKCGRLFVICGLAGGGLYLFNRRCSDETDEEDSDDEWNINDGFKD